jgi:hypothetical protein
VGELVDVDEKQYWDSDPNFDGDDGDEITYEFLLEEEADVDIVIVPKYEFDIEKHIDQYLKEVSRCKNRSALKTVLMKMLGDAQVKIMLQRDYYEMQDKIKNLEAAITMLGIAGVKTDL